MERQGISMKQAGAILASSTRNASAKAKRANPILKQGLLSLCLFQSFHR